MLKLYNTLTKKKQVLQTRSRKNISVFVCGPTVYDYSHLGHARTYISFDSFVRFLRVQGYHVTYVQNITDIDDKIIKRAQEKNLPTRALAKMFEKEYFKDMNSLGVKSVNTYARATDYIPEIISQVKRLLKKKIAYEIKEDGIYYDISKFKGYGKLSGRTSSEAEDATSRIDESIKKQNKGDFALWKFSPPSHKASAGKKEREPKWDSPWGWGRPGWHIEDTAITEKHFGVQYELHGGARDLIFPHHEAEIAQMEAISGKKPMAKFWMHSGFLTVEGEKMSKSLGNFITIQDFLKEYSPRILRLLVLKTHYRSPIDYSEKLLLQTERELERIDEFVDRLKAKPHILSSTKELLSRTKDAKQAFQKALEDDFNTPKAIAAVFDLITYGNKMVDAQKLSKRDAEIIIAFLKEADKVFGFVFWGRQKQEKVPAGILKLSKQREMLRIEGKWGKADELRKRIGEKGWMVEDTPTGSRLKKA